MTSRLNQNLKDVRLSRHLSVNDVARDTSISASRIIECETSDKAQVKDILTLMDYYKIDTKDFR